MYFIYQYKMANLISKLNFWKLIPYPMDNCWLARLVPSNARKRRPVYTTSRTGHGVCIRHVAHRTSFLSRHDDIIASFSVSSPIKTPSKLIVGPDGWALPVHWIGY